MKTPRAGLIFTLVMIACASSWSGCSTRDADAPRASSIHIAPAYDAYERDLRRAVSERATKAAVFERLGAKGMAIVARSELSSVHCSEELRVRAQAKFGEYAATYHLDLECDNQALLFFDRDNRLMDYEHF
jgi:hypothetical protein